jgi:hypothetical protein
MEWPLKETWFAVSVIELIAAMLSEFGAAKPGQFTTGRNLTGHHGKSNYGGSSNRRSGPEPSE